MKQYRGHDLDTQVVYILHMEKLKPKATGQLRLLYSSYMLFTQIQNFSDVNVEKHMLKGGRNFS